MGLFLLGEEQGCPGHGTGPPYYFDNINDNSNEPFVKQDLPANCPSRALWDGRRGQEKSKPEPCEGIGPLETDVCQAPGWSSPWSPLVQSLRCPRVRPILGPIPQMGKLRLRELKSPVQHHSATEGRAETKARPIS